LLASSRTITSCVMDSMMITDPGLPRWGLKPQWKKRGLGWAGRMVLANTPCRSGRGSGTPPQNKCVEDGALPLHVRQYEDVFLGALIRLFFCLPSSRSYTIIVRPGEKSRIRRQAGNITGQTSPFRGTKPPNVGARGPPLPIVSSAGPQILYQQGRRALDRDGKLLWEVVADEGRNEAPKKRKRKRKRKEKKKKKQRTPKKYLRLPKVLHSSRERKQLRVQARG